MIKEEKKRNFKSIFSIGFLLAFSMAIPTYVSSSFLSTLASEKLVGLFYTTASLVTIVLLVGIPLVLRKIGNYKTSFLFFILNILSLLALAFCSNPLLVGLTFIIHLILTTLLSFNLDVFLENSSEDESTGYIRGSYLTLVNIAWLISPLVTGFVLTNGDYWKIFTISAIVSLLVVFLLSQNFRKFQDPIYEKTKFWKTLKIIGKRKNIFRIFFSQLFLRFFYSWMVIYMPIYLHEHIGFDWSIIGIIFTVMLIPFVLMELPLGKLADNKIGEKEILNIGFIITAVATGTITFITSTNPIVWAFVLFMTRVGASMIEISSESYFFKKIKSDDTNILSVFRMSRPIAYTFGPLLASVLLFFVDFKFLFIILGFIVLIGGLSFGLRIKDTK